MLPLVMLLAVAQFDLTGAPGASAPVKDEATESGRLTAEPTSVADVPHAHAAKRSAGLFHEPRVKPGVLLGRMGMGLLFGGLASSVSGALLVVAAFGSASAVVLVLGGVLAASLVGLGTGLGAAMFGSDYGRDFLDALVVSMASAAIAGLLFIVGFFVPVLLWPMAILAGGLMVVGVPLFVQAFKSGDDGPDATVALLRF